VQQLHPSETVRKNTQGTTTTAEAQEVVALLGMMKRKKKNTHLIDVARREMGSLVFARVTRVILKDKHKNDGGEYSHFCGYARTADNVDIWWKKGAHLPILFVAGVSHETRLDNVESYPKRGDLMVGAINDTPKGKVYEWWSFHAEPIHAFHDFLLTGAKSMRIKYQAYAALRMSTTRARTPDDMYLLSRLLLLRDTGVLAAENHKDDARKALRPERRTKKRGHALERSPTRFCFLAALFARDPSILAEYYDACKAMSLEEEAFDPECSIDELQIRLNHTLP